MLDGLFSPTRLDGVVPFSPSEGGAPAWRVDGPGGSIHAPDVAYGYREQCDDDSYLVVPSARNGFGGSALKRVQQWCKAGWIGMRRWISTIVR
jgi:hypothetical protein